MRNFYDYTQSSLITEFDELGFSKLDAKRVYPWIYKKRATSIEQMTDLPTKVREELPKYFCFSNLSCKKLITSSDGTMKALLELSDGETVENVLIKDGDRVTLCISTQIGCQMKCKFCNTGTQRFVRNLTCGELVGQYLYWINEQKQNITNIVVMGMGEPFMNLENVSNWLDIMLDKNGFNMSRHRITVSTSGITDKILEFGEQYKVELAISLHAPNNAVRSQIMPINNAYPLEKLLSIVKQYPSVSNTDYITFEYLMLAGVNDSLEHAKELHKLVSYIKCKVNLIVYNEWPGDIFKGSDRETVERFQYYLKSKNIMCTIRKSKGKDILAACGQLKTETAQAL